MNLKLSAALATAVSLALGGGATASPVLDQSSVPSTGVIAHSTGGGVTLFLPQLAGQSFTVGLSGKLTEIDVGVFDFDTFDPPSEGVTFSLYDTPGGTGPSLFTRHLDAQSIPYFYLGGSGWGSLHQFNLTSAHVSVHPGEMMSFVLTPDAGTVVTLSYLFSVDGQPLSYSGGSMLVGPAGALLPSYTFLSNGSPVPANGAFRTYVTVPEPETWALMIGGFGLVGAQLRRPRRAALASR
jgi:hypothetical protein